MTDMTPESTAEYRSHLNAARETASRDYDKALLTLAAGALGISLVFVHDVAPHPTHTAWLGWSWALFGVSLLCVVASLLTSQWALLRAVSASEAKDQHSYDTAHQSRFSKATTWLNLGAGVSFMVGVGLLIVFAFHNLKGA